MTRTLTEVEAAWVLALLEHGTTSPDGPHASSQDRRRWREQLPHTRVGGHCGCGSCPSIELVDVAGTAPEFADRIVLEGSLTDLADPRGQPSQAIVLLFIDSDRLSHLELAPMDDVSVPAFPRLRS